MTEHDQYRQLLIDAICGVGFPRFLLAQECEKVGLATIVYSGKGDPERWEWERQMLWGCSTDQLQELYSTLCDAREDNFTPTEELDDEPRLILTGH